MPDLPASGGLHVHPGYRVFDTNDGLLEQVTGLVLRRPAAQRGPTGEGAATTLLDLPEAVGARLSGIRHAIAVVPHESLEGSRSPTKWRQTRRRLWGAGCRYGDAALANLAAARRAALQVLSDSRVSCRAVDIELTDRADGKPLQRVALPSGRMLEKLDLSLADDTAYSVAFLGPGPVGVDIEPVEARDRELWHALLGADGFMLASELTSSSGEPFDVSATRVWTLIEAGQEGERTGENRPPRLP